MGRFSSLPTALITDDSALGGSTIEKSLRFNDGDSPELRRTFGTNTSNTTKTFSCWMKRGTLGTAQNIMSTTISGNIEGRLRINSDDTLQFEDRDASGGTSDGRRQTTAKLRDTTNWYHIMLVLDSTQANEADRAKIYINGEQVTAFAATRSIAQNYSFSFNRSSAVNYIGNMSGSSEFFDGYLAEINFIDGIALDASYFGYTEFQTGIWRPKRYEGSYNNNGFHLEFKDNTNNAAMGRDTSGQGNDFTVENIASSHDNVPDSPTNNFATFNTQAGYGGNGQTFDNGNLRSIAGGSGNGGAPINFGLSSGKWYVEMLIEYNGNGVQTGLSGQKADYDSFPVNDGIYSGASGEVVNNGTNTYPSTPSFTFSDGDIIGLALDIPGGTIKWYKNNTLGYTRNLSDITSGGNEDSVYFFTAVDGSSATGGRHVLNAGQDSTFNGNKTQQGKTDENGIGDFYYTPPSGHLAVCSNNLPANTNNQPIRPEQHMKCLTWTGNSTNNRRITGLEFKPDLVWIKKRNVSIMSHYFISSAQTYTSSGTGNGNVGAFRSGINSNEAVATTTDGGFVSFNNDGFTLGKGDNDNNADSAYQRMNANSANYVAWCWKAGGAPVTNNEGTVTASVSANPKAGFSMVTYTGSGGHVTRGHGLGRKPQWIIMKTTSHAGDWWFNLDDSAIPAAGYDRNYLRINNTAGVEGPNSNIAPNQAPDGSAAITDSIYSIGGDMNESGKQYVNYLWASVPGYSKIGSYTGNANTNGPFIYTGFPIAYVIIKRASGTGPWNIWDNGRLIRNPRDTALNANSSAKEEDGGRDIDFYSNGFKIRNHGTEMNNGNYIYLAFAQEVGPTVYQSETNAQQ